MYMSCGHCLICCFFFFKQKTAYEMRISDWSSDVCSSDLDDGADGGGDVGLCVHVQFLSFGSIQALGSARASAALIMVRSEEHTSELQSLMRISYAVFCLKKKKTRQP